MEKRGIAGRRAAPSPQRGFAGSDPRGPKTLRDQLVQEGKLLDHQDPNFSVFAEDIPFNSPSAAAAVVFGSTARPVCLEDQAGWSDLPRVARS